MNAKEAKQLSKRDYNNGMDCIYETIIEACLEQRVYCYIHSRINSDQIQQLLDQGYIVTTNKFNSTRISW